MTSLTFDAGGLVALDRNSRRVLAILARAREQGAHVIVPATALAQAIRHPGRQARLSRLLRHPATHVTVLDRADATRVGILLASTKTSDIVDAHVVVCAMRGAEPVVTSDAKDLRRLDPRLRLLVV